MSSEFGIFLVTVGSAAEAEKIAVAIVEEKLAACCTIVDKVHSVYRWEGKLCRDEEWLLIIKSKKEMFDELSARVKSLHSYKTPEFLLIPIERGDADYLAWLSENCLSKPLQ